MRDTSDRAGWRATVRGADMRDAITDHPIWRVPGASPILYRGDWMHTAEKGLLLHMNGSALHDLMDGRFAGHSFELRVDEMWKALQRHLSRG